MGFRPLARLSLRKNHENSVVEAKTAAHSAVVAAGLFCAPSHKDVQSNNAHKKQINVVAANGCRTQPTMGGSLGERTMALSD